MENLGRLIGLGFSPESRENFFHSFNKSENYSLAQRVGLVVLGVIECIPVVSFVVSHAQRYLEGRVTYEEVNPEKTKQVAATQLAELPPAPKKEKLEEFIKLVSERLLTANLYEKEPGIFREQGSERMIRDLQARFYKEEIDADNFKEFQVGDYQIEGEFFPHTLNVNDLAVLLKRFVADYQKQDGSIDNLKSTSFEQLINGVADSETCKLDKDNLNIAFPGISKIFS